MDVAIILLKHHRSEMTTNGMLFLLDFLPIIINVATNFYDQALYDHIFLVVYGIS